MEKKIIVYLELNNIPQLVGYLWAHTRKNKTNATFEYHKNWLTNPESFAIDPILTLNSGSFHTPPNQLLFGALGDSAPDRWGRALMRRFERNRAEKRGETPKTLQEIDYLLMVNDETRQGALRFTQNEDGIFLTTEGKSIPPLIDLPKLLSATEHVIDETDTDEDLKLLLAPGSSLGGARPKASVRNQNGDLCIAKFPHKDDDINIVLWEAVALTLAQNAGIIVPSWRVQKVANRDILLLKRFDRNQKERIPFLSAMSMLAAADNESHSYLEIADALKQYGKNPTQDLHALWKRIIFNICISNTDDHLRNHGFLYKHYEGWQLSPAYDLNPVPIDIKPRILSTNITLDDGTASVELALEIAEYFELNLQEANHIISDVKQAVQSWQQVAKNVGLTQSEITRMSSAFISP